MVIVVTGMGPGQARGGARIIESSLRLRCGGGTARRSDRRLRAEPELERTHAAPLLAAADGDPELRRIDATAVRADHERAGALILGKAGADHEGSHCGRGPVELGVCNATVESAGAGLWPARRDRAATRSGGCGTARRSSPGPRSL